MKREVDPGHGRRPWIARLTLAAVIVGLLGLAARVVVTLAAADLMEQKLAGAERYLYYRITPSTGPTFQLTGDETAVRLVTHAVLPAASSYDPAVELEYGIHVSLDLGGGKKWERDVYTRARQSKARLTSGKNAIWLDENTFALDRDIELTDDRLLVLALPSHVPTGATFKVTMLEMQEGYVRAYTPVPREDASRRARDLPLAQRSRLASQLSYLPWDRLSSPEQLATMRFAEQRLSAEGKEGDDYQTRTLYTTGFRVRASTTIERGILITAEHGAAVNVVGPAHVDVTITRPASFAATAGSLQLALVGEGTPPAPVSIPLPIAGASVTRAIDVPEGVFTATLVTTAPARIELVPPASKPVALGGAAGAPLVPDEQAASVYVSDPGGPPIAFSIDGPQDLLGRVLRVDVRALASTPQPEIDANRIVQWPQSALPTAAPASPAFALEPVSAHVTLETLDAAGKLIATTTAELESLPSRFETAKLFGKLAAMVCEPVGLRFVVPDGGKTVRIRTDRPALLQVMAPIAISPAFDRLESPYDAVVLTTTRWRYARYLERGWLPIRSPDHDKLIPERVALLLSQARLEPRVVPPPPDVLGTSLPATGTGSHQTVIERVAPEDVADFIAKWDEGHFTRFVPGKRIALDFGRLPTRPAIRYVVNDAAVGMTVSIAIDNVQVADQRLTTTRGTLKLPSGTTGTHTLTVTTKANAQLLVDRPPVKTSAELFALRSVYAIGRGRHVRLPIVKHSAAKQNINILVYTSRPDTEATVRVRIDGGAPSRTNGTALTTWSLADRTVPLPPADRAPTLGFADAKGGPLHPRRLVVALGDDLPAGKHTIDLSISGDNVWARFFTLDNAPVQARALQWRDTAEDMP